MLSSENSVIVASALATVAGVGLVAFLEGTVGFPGEWAIVLAFVVLVAVGFVLPQAYLLRVDESTPSWSRLGVVTLMLFLLATVYTNSVTGTERAVLWGIVLVSVALIFVSEAREGYRESRPADSR